MDVDVGHLRPEADDGPQEYRWNRTGRKHLFVADRKALQSVFQPKKLQTGLHEGFWRRQEPVFWYLEWRSLNLKQLLRPTITVCY
jgi:hypothetical protein